MMHEKEKINRKKKRKLKRKIKKKDLKIKNMNQKKNIIRKETKENK
jgi:hypothetical protein